MSLSGMSLSTLMPFIIKVIKYYLPSGLALIICLVAIVELLRLKGILNPGNLPKYNPDKLEKQTTDLTGKNIIFLGSSVTKGFAAYGKSFADMIGARNGATVYKHAVSGTTLINKGKGKSYVERLTQIDTNEPCDVFVVQLSTNDATFGSPIGKLGTKDTKTVIGAMEFIIDYVEEHWSCPIVFYTNPVYDSVSYYHMTEALAKVAKARNISVVDFWNDAEINAKANKKRTKMNDSIHPTKAGYQTWLNKFEDVLIRALHDEKVAFDGPANTEAEIQKLQSKKKVGKVLSIILKVILCFLLFAIYVAYSFLGALSYPTDAQSDPNLLPEKQTVDTSSPLYGHTILSIGSSVSVGQPYKGDNEVHGDGNGGISFEDYLIFMEGANVICIDEGATTVAIREGLNSSYVERVQRDADPSWPVEAVILQVSTNDASAGNGIGAVTDSFDGNYDVTTTCGGLEFIIDYVTKTWNCPVVIYTCAPFESGPLYDADAYDNLVNSVHTVVDKWNTVTKVTIVDLWNEPSLQNLSKEDIIHHKVDPVHPSQAGYIDWYMPAFREALYPFFK